MMGNEVVKAQALSYGLIQILEKHSTGKWFTCSPISDEQSLPPLGQNFQFNYLFKDVS